MQPALGALPSLPDYRDDIATAFAGMPAQPTFLPTTAYASVGPVLMQAQEPACVSHSFVELLKLYWFRKTGEWIDFSPRFLDILSAEPDIPLDGGRRDRTVLKVIYTQGCCTTATLPNDTTLPIAQYRNPNAITTAAREEAAKYKIPGFVSVGIDLLSLREAIKFYGAVSSLFFIGDELWIPSWLDADIDPMRTPKAIVGGHQMTDVGWYTPTLNRLRNHWSAEWANNGEIDYDPVAWLPYTVERWAIAEIPQDIADFLKNLPAPSDFHYAWNMNLAQGMQNDDVKWAQVALMILGYLGAVAPAEFGIYGPKTAAAVAKLQAANGISPVPASIGPKTRAILNSNFSI